MPGTSPPEARAPDGRPTRVVALFVAVSWAAVVFAADGVLAVVLSRDPVPPGQSPYYGLLALVAAGIVVWLGVALGAAGNRPALAALATGAAVYLTIVASGLVGGLRLTAHQAVSPFTAVAVVAAVVAVPATCAAIRARHSGD